MLLRGLIRVDRATDSNGMMRESKASYELLISNVKSTNLLRLRSSRAESSATWELDSAQRESYDVKHSNESSAAQTRNQTR